MKKLSLFLAMVFLTIGMSYAQRTITGTVTDDTGEALVGASVVAKGTTSGGVSDLDGNYKVVLPSGSTTLVVSMVGFTTQELAIGATNVMNVSMSENAASLGEVVVTAVGIQREKRALGYAVSDVSGDALAQRSEPDALRALQGKVPGVIIQGGGGSPGQSTKINIRGISSLSGNTQPLFVVDGIPFDNSVNASTGAAGGTQFSNRAFDIDPNNIESMTVLKGAAASALYGSRATNGVIVITTKTGKKSRKGLEVSYNTSLSWEKIASTPTYQEKYGQGSNNVYNGAFIGNWGTPFGQYADAINAQYGTDYPRIDSVKHPLLNNGFAVGQGYPAVFGATFADGTKNPNGLPAMVPYQNWNFIDDFFQTGQLVENALSISSGNETTSVSASASHMTNKGIVPNAKSGRTALAFGGTSRLSNGLLISGNLNYVNTSQANPPEPGSIFESGWYGGSAEGSIFARLFYLPRNYNLTNYPSENPITGNNIFYRALDNPLWLVKNARYTSNVNRVYGGITAAYDVNSWLNLMVRGGVNTYAESRKNQVRPGSYALPNGQVWTDNLVNTEIDLNYIATISKKINEDFDFRMILGLNQNQREYERHYASGNNLITVGNYSIGNSTSQTALEEHRKQRLYAYYGDAQLSFKNSLFLGLVARNDHTSTLPTDNNSFWYGGANLSWAFTDMFNIKSKVLSFGKLRLAYTQVGNEASPYQTATTYNINQAYTSSNGTVYNNASLDNLRGNPTLRNELTGEFETGTDLRFFGNRLGVDFTYFNRSSTDQITEAALAPTTGFNGAVVNVGQVDNEGIELGLDISPIKTDKGFNWNAYVTFTKIKTTIVNAGESGEIFLIGPASSLGNVHRDGLPYGQIYGTKIARGPNGEMLIDRATGLTIISPKSDVIGNPNPDFIAGLVNTFSYKGLSLKTVLDWREGGDIYSITTGALLARGQLAITEDREPLRVIPGVYGNPATYEALTDENGAVIKNTTPTTAFGYHFSNGFGPYGADETNVYDGTTYRLREVTLAYDVPKKMLKGSPFGAARVSFTGRNLWFKAPYFAKGINLDPEVLAETAESNLQGFEYGGHPTTRRYGVNLSFTF